MSLKVRYWDLIGREKYINARSASDDPDNFGWNIQGLEGKKIVGVVAHPDQMGILIFYED